jgi:cytochrome P450
VFSRLTAPDALLNPYPIYKEYRTQSSIVDSGIGLWFAFGHQDCLILLRDRRTSVEESKSLYPPTEPHELATLIQIDPPDHDRLRNMVQLAFTPRRVKALRERAGNIAILLLGSAKGDERVFENAA